MKKVLPILIILVSIAAAFMLQFELYNFYNKDYRKVETLDELEDAVGNSIVEIDITPNLFFYLEDQELDSQSFFLTYEFENKFVINATRRLADEENTSFNLKGTVRKLSADDPLYKSIIELSDSIPLIELTDSIDADVLQNIQVDWSTDLSEDLLLFEQIKPPAYPNTRFLLGLILVGSSVLIAIFVAVHNKEE
jgi:hypothetical protein